MVSCNDFVLVSNVLFSRCKNAFVDRGPMPRFQVLVRGAALKFVRKHSCKAQAADFAPVSEVLQSAEAENNWMLRAVVLIT